MNCFTPGSKPSAPMWSGSSGSDGEPDRKRDGRGARQPLAVDTEPGTRPAFLRLLLFIEGFLTRFVVGDIDHVLDLVDVLADGLLDPG
jgi:hypothetical protein